MGRCVFTLLTARETAWTLVGGSVPALEAGDGGCWVVLMPFLKPLMPQTHTVPGFRLGPDRPRNYDQREDESALSLYKGFFYFKALVWESIILLVPPHPHLQSLP